MILSWRHKFLFIKTIKTAGTSIEADLAGHVEDEAIVTPIEPPVPGHVPRNFRHPDGDFVNHMRAAEVRDRIGVDAYNSLFKFCVEREPVAKCLSHFHMLKRSPATAAQYADVSWDDYCRAGKFPISMMLYGQPTGVRPLLLLDRVLPYETLATDLPALLETLGITGFRLQARAKSEFSRDRILSVDEVTEDQRATIYRAFKVNLLLHGLYPVWPD